MKEMIEFLIPRERYVELEASLPSLASHAAQVTAWGVRLQFWDSRDAAREFYQLHKHRFEEPPGFPYVKRKYSSIELDRAEILHLFVWSLVETSGREFPNVYDEGDVCPACGSCARQVGDLVIDLPIMPRQDLVMTLAGEFLCSQKLRSLLTAAPATGVGFGPVRSLATGRVSRKWSQLLITSKLSLSIRTQFGIDPFDFDSAGKYVCAVCGRRGAIRISEAFVRRSTWTGSDFAVSEERAGVRLGLYEPWRLVFISPRAYRLLRARKISGFGVEAAHLD